jgi:hypothetical protein
MTVHNASAEELRRFWRVGPLDADDRRLVDAYQQAGVPLDALPYTDAFERLVERLGHGEPTRERMHDVFRQLLRLRKMGRLPRLRTALDDSE